MNTPPGGSGAFLFYPRKDEHTMTHHKPTPEESAVWDAFNADCSAAAAAHLPHDPNAYERARGHAERAAWSKIARLRQDRAERPERIRGVHRSLIPFESDLS